MRQRIVYGLIAAAGCLVVPLLARVPRGMDWVGQYIVPGGNLAGLMFFGGFALVPGLVLFGAFLLSRRPLYAPGVLATFFTYVVLVLLHFDNDLSIDAQASFTLMIFPLLAAIVALATGVVGLVAQLFIPKRSQ